MNLNQAVSVMGPSLALKVFEEAGLTPSVPFAEWMEVFAVVNSVDALNSHGHHNEFSIQDTLARDVALELGRAAQTFEEKCAVIEKLIECSSTDDRDLTMVEMKFEIFQNLVSGAKTADKIERVHDLLDRGSRVWSMTLTYRTLPPFHKRLRLNAVDVATTCTDWYNIARRIKGCYPEWHEAVKGMIVTAGDSVADWVMVHKEGVRVNHHQTKEQAHKKLVELLRS